MTRPNRSTIPACEPSSLKPDLGEIELISAPEKIFDASKFTSFLDICYSNTSDLKSFRDAIVVELRRIRKAGMIEIDNSFTKNPLSAEQVIRSYTWLTDSIIKSVWHICKIWLHPVPNPTQAEKLSIIAVGGYGRKEMAPYSDVDLLFLTPYKTTPWAESVIESILYILWDLKLKIGHSSRTISDCLRLGKEDYTIRTALLEQRFVDGDHATAKELEMRLWKDLFKLTAKDFISAKLEERDLRHEKQGGQRYMVEPNVKEGKGGLRDLQSLFWIAKYLHHVKEQSELVDLGMLRKEEFVKFQQAENFLWAVRCHLHILTNRASDQLSFDLQVETAERMGYQDSKGRRAVEVFMQDYFTHATRVGDITRIFLTALEAQHVKEMPLLQRIFRRLPQIKDPYTVLQNRLSVKSFDAFLEDKLNLLRLFEEALRTGLLIHPDAMRAVSANISLFDHDMRQNKEAQRIFMDLLIKHGNPERALRRMNELGALAAFIPEFQPIVAMMQFNMYHSYTVDEHTIQCISHLAQIEREELIEELPIASSILKSGANKRILYTSLLLHDIGKGQNEDHSVLGARIARKVAPRLGLNKKEVETVEWLIRYHLLMSDMAQKRDIADPRTVRDFAKAVQTVNRLDLLTVLTVCDIRGVGPNTWNNWKAVLIRALYRQTKKVLENGYEALTRENRGAEAKKNLKLRLVTWESKQVRAELSRHYDPYWQGLHITAHETFAHLLKEITDDGVKIDLHPDQDRDATRICFALSDHPGIFSRLAGALALVGANVVDARTYTSKDGYATAAFWVQDKKGNPYKVTHLRRLHDMIEKTLKGEVITQDAIKDRDRLKRRERAFKVPTSITFDNDGSEIYTLIEVDTRDRPGLLFDLTRALANMNVYIASAVIATYGEQVVDTFYVKDAFGLKFHSLSKQRALEDKLRVAIELGVKRAEM